MITDLRNATPDTCGGKAGTLGLLLRAGFRVPEGFVVPVDPESGAGPGVGSGAGCSERLTDRVAAELMRMGDPVVAVRSSGLREDSAGASAAGQYESTLGVQGQRSVAAAIESCRASAASGRVAAYWANTAGPHGAAAPDPRLAVLVQRLIDADVSGVMFTPERPDAATRIEASWGLGLGVVGGTVTPDAYEVAPDGGVRCMIGRKTTRLDRDERGLGVRTRSVPESLQTTATLTDRAARQLAGLGARVAARLGGDQDIEWAMADGVTWVLQSRPVTVPIPAAARRPAVASGAALYGTPGAHGQATATARIVRRPSDFGRVAVGDILICPFTDPAWTPLFPIAAGVITEMGGVLSHAAIVAREYGIPAVLGVPDATTRVPDGARVTIDGTTGSLTVH